MIAMVEPLPSIAYYDEFATRLAPTYDSISFEQANAGIGPYLPTAPARVLDVGAGSGRDARALAAMGHDVMAVEPSGAFRSIAAAADAGVAWIDDRLPNLPGVTSLGTRFDFILCSAVLMLIPPVQLGRTFETLSRLLANSGRLAVTLRAPVGTEPRDVFHAHADEDVVRSAAAAGLDAVKRAMPNDALGRYALRWHSYVFERMRLR